MGKQNTSSDKRNMQKYANASKKHFKPKRDPVTGEHVVKPFDDAQGALAKAVFSKKEREEFFTEAYSEILIDLFKQWLGTEPHCSKEREYLYHTAMALGSVKEQLIKIENFGYNAEFIEESQLDSTEESE